MKFCPNCGSTDIQDAGSVFIEDGPYTKHGYLNEGDFSRFGCNTCRLYFGEMPQPIICSCGQVVEDSEGEQQDDESWICSECVAKQAKASREGK